MLVATSIAAWPDAVGKRVSIAVSEIDDSTGKIISDNKRIDKVVVDKEGKALIDNLLDYAQSIVDAE